MRNLTKVVPLFIVVVMGLSMNAETAQAGYKETFVELLEIYYGNVCDAKIEGWLTKTLKVDWTKNTVKLHVIKIFAEVGDAKEELYRDGVRYFKFPNDAGGYNIVDWETGEMKSVSDRAPYYFTE